MSKWGLLVAGGLLLVAYNAAQSDVMEMRAMPFETKDKQQARELEREQYGPSMKWLDRVLAASSDKVEPNQSDYTAKLDLRVLSSLMVAGLASGFKSQVANLLWMKSDEYWHKGLTTRQNPLMEAVVTLDPQFIDAWSTAGWHWAYNIYADIELNPKYKDNPKAMRVQQEKAIATGLDYLRRGSEQNPEKYRLWFEHGWTRAEKAGYYDEETVELYRKARAQDDARQIEVDTVVNGKSKTVKKQGADILGRTIAHLYESVPELDRALDQYGNDLLQGTPQELAELREVGRYWSLYGSDYEKIVNAYEKGDAVLKNRIKAIVPDVDKMAKAHKTRMKMQARNDQPTGAYITLVARYQPAWEMYKSGQYQQAIDKMVGVMNANPKHHLQGLPKLAQVLELSGDAPEAIKAELEKMREAEKTSSQDIGIHFLAKIYDRMTEAQTDPTKKRELAKQAYEMWYRARARKTLDFYARRKTLNYEDKYGFTAPKEIVDAVKKSRQGSGGVNAAPEAPPNVGNYYQPLPNQSHDHDGDGVDDHTGETATQT